MVKSSMCDDPPSQCWWRCALNGCSRTGPWWSNQSTGDHVAENATQKIVHWWRWWWCRYRFQFQIISWRLHAHKNQKMESSNMSVMVWTVNGDTLWCLIWNLQKTSQNCVMTILCKCCGVIILVMVPCLSKALMILLLRRYKCCKHKVMLWSVSLKVIYAW